MCEGQYVSTSAHWPIWTLFPFVLQGPTISVVENLACKIKPCCVTVNPFIPGEVTIAMETGSLYLWSENASLQVVKKCSAFIPKDFDWYFCEFGTHPRQILYCNKTNVELLDLRVLLTLAPATCKSYILTLSHPEALP